MYLIESTNSVRIIKTMRTFLIISAILIFNFKDVHGIGRCVPNGTVNVLVDGGIDIYCIINLLEFPGRDSSTLYFEPKSNMTGLNLANYTRIINETTIQLKMRNLPEMDEKFYCKSTLNNDTKGVDMAYVRVGYKPGNVTDFKCISHNWEYMICEFHKPHNPITTEYKLKFRVVTDSESLNLMKYNCELESKFNRLYICNLQFENKQGGGVYRQMYSTYIFTLYAYNPFENTTQEFTIDHFASVVPAEPPELIVYNITYNSAELSWKIPSALKEFKIGLISNITIKSEYEEYPPIGEKFPRKGDYYTYRITGLKYPYTQYIVDVKLRVETAPNTDEMWSKSITRTFTTKKMAPYEPPSTDIGSFYIQADRIYFYWKELSPEKHNGPNLIYNMSFESNNYNFIKTTHIAQQNVNRILPLRDGFIVKIRSQNDIGSSPNASIIRVPRNKLPVPQNIKKFFSRKVYNITWEPPLNYEYHNITSYTVFRCIPSNGLSTQCEKSFDFVRVNVSTLHYTYDLPKDSDKLMNFAVSANSDNSTSGMVWALCQAPPSNEIGSVMSFQAVEKNALSIEYTWFLTCADKSIVKFFNFTYCMIGKLNNSEQCEGKPISSLLPDNSSQNDDKTYRHTITNLKPYTSYRASISMISIDDHVGEDSSIVELTTNQAAPSIPLNVHVLAKTNTSILLGWESPEYMNGPLKEYEISYSQNQIIRTTHLEYRLNSLKSYTDYNISVRACTEYCSNRSVPIIVKTGVGVPSEVRSVQLNRTGNTLTWAPPQTFAGNVDFYEIKTTITKDKMKYEYVDRTNYTQCTLQIHLCDDDKYDFVVRAVNVEEMNGSGRKEKRNSSPEIDSRASSLNTNFKSNRSEKGYYDESSLYKPDPRLICRENSQRFRLENLTYLEGNWSSSTIYDCNMPYGGVIWIAIVFGILGIALCFLAIYKLGNKFRKMKDISVEYPAGLEDIKDDAKTSLDFNSPKESNDIVRSTNDDNIYNTCEQQESLLRNRAESDSSNNTGSTSSRCEYNEGIEESESERQNDNNSERSSNENLDADKFSPTPLLPITPPIELSPPQTRPPPIITPQNFTAAIIPIEPRQNFAFPISSNNYVPASVLMQPTTGATNGYVSVEELINKPAIIPSSGYLPISAITGLPPQQTQRTSLDTSPDDGKGKNAMTTNTDIQGICGYVTHKQLSDFGQLMH